MNADEKISEANNALAVMWRNVANWHTFNKKPDNGVRFFVMRNMEIKRVENDFLKLHDHLPSDYVAQSNMFPNYYKMV